MEDNFAQFSFRWRRDLKQQHFIVANAKNTMYKTCGSRGSFKKNKNHDKTYVIRLERKQL